MAAKFTDRHGGEWTLLITFGVIDRVQSETGIDLAAVMEDHDRLAAMLFKGMGRKLVETLHCICADQIIDRQTTSEAWADLFDGPTVERASSAFLEAIADFFPRSRVGKAIKEDLPGMLEEMDAEIIKTMRTKTKRPRPVGFDATVSRTRAALESVTSGHSP
jgi:hypothetical protein